MSPFDEQVVRQVLSDYGMKLGSQRFEMGPGRLAFQDQSRWYELRITTPSSAYARQVIGDYAAQRKYRNTQRFLENNAGQRIVHIGSGEVAYVTTYWSQESLTGKPGDWTMAARNLAALHKAIEGCGSTLEGSSTTSLSKELTPSYHEWRLRIERFSEALSVERAIFRQRPLGAGLDTWCLAWLRDCEEFLHHIEQVLNDLGFEDLCQEAQSNREVAWNSYSLPHLRTLASGNMGTLQVTDPVLDFRWRDLVSLIQPLWAAGDSETIQTILSIYAGSAPLEPRERAIVKALGAAPMYALHLLRELRKASAVGTQRAIRERLERHLETARQLTHLD